MADLTAIVLVFNEERHIERLLDNLRPLCKAVFVIDSHSTDRTVALAKDGGAQVLTHTFDNYARQFDWGLHNARIETRWVMRIDADELLTPELIGELEDRLPLLSEETTGVNINRRHIFLGRWVRRGGRYPLTLLRIWRRGCAEIEQRWMDEHMVLTCGRATTMAHDFIDHNLNDLTFFSAKHNAYATREALDQIARKYGLVQISPALAGDTTSKQAAWRRRVKENIYNRLPLWAGPAAYFLYRYLFLFGFLDGREGLLYHVLQGFCYRFLVAAKVFEYERALSEAAETERKIEVLSRLTGYRLTAGDGFPEIATAALNSR